jgi:hypothetical protein
MKYSHLITLAFQTDGQFCTHKTNMICQKNELIWQVVIDAINFCLVLFSGELYCIDVNKN